MNFASIRIVTADVDRLVRFYARLTGVEPVRPIPDFAEFRFGGFVLAISAESVVARFNAGAAVAAANRSLVIEFHVDDVDAAAAGLGADAELVMPPTTMPWGNRSMLLRDPDGNAVNLFARPAVAA